MRIRAAIFGSGLALMAGVAMAQDTGGGQPDSLQETYRDWLVRCARVADAATGAEARACEVSQELIQAETGQRILSAAFRREADGTAALTLIAPFGLNLADGVTLSVDGAELARIPFRTCLPRGCIATATLDSAALDRLGAGTQTGIGLVADGGEPLALNLSLAGFADAWVRLGSL